MKYCNNCNTEIEDFDNYCIECGAEQLSHPKFVVDKYCEECGTKIENGDLFCTECGNTVSYCSTNELTESQNKPNSKRNTSSKAIINVIIIVLIISIIFTGIYLFYLIKDNKSVPVSETTNTQTSTTSETTEEIKKNIDYNIYKSVLQKYAESNYEMAMYFLADLDKDKTYELLIEYGNFEYLEGLDIYKINNDSAEFVDSFDLSYSSFHFCKNGEMYLFYANGSYYSLSQVILFNGELTTKEVIFKNHGETTDYPYSDVFEYLDSKTEITYLTAAVSDYSLLDSVSNGAEPATEIVSYYEIQNEENSTSEKQTAKSTTKEITTQQETASVTIIESESPTTSKYENIIIPASPVTLKISNIAPSRDGGYVEITDLKIEDYELTGYIKNTNSQLADVKLIYKFYNNQGVCLYKSSIYETDMSADEKRKIRINLSYYASEITEVRFDTEASSIRFG
ncbi:MAG: zinc ribbon domain-containing protein [Eubacterium sp.]